MKIKSIPNWTTNIEEISNNVYRVTLVDNFGRKIEIVDDALEEIIEKALQDALHIENRFRITGRSWSIGILKCY